jgi:hypothetical protein
VHASCRSDASSDQVQPLLLAEEGVVTFHNDQDDEALDRLESRYERWVVPLHDVAVTL